MNAPIRVVDLGRRGYADTLELQRSLCRRRISRDSPTTFDREPMPRTLEPEMAQCSA